MHFKKPKSFAGSVIAAALLGTLSSVAFVQSCTNPTYRCAANTDCVSGRCLITATQSVCVEAAPDCPSLLRYARSAPNAGACVEGPTPPTDMGGDVQDATSPDVNTDMGVVLPDIPTPDVPSDVPSDVPTVDVPVAMCTPLAVQRAVPPVLAPVMLNGCEVRIVTPLSQRLNTGRAVQFQARVGNNVQSAYVEIVDLPIVMGDVPSSTQMAIAGGNATLNWVSHDERKYAARWTIRANCAGGSTMSTEPSILALPRPYTFDNIANQRCSAPMQPEFCSSAIAPVATNIDVNLDGRSDLVASQPGFIMVQPASDMGQGPVTRYCLESSRLGANIESVGDLDGDGRSDFLVSDCNVNSAVDQCTQRAIAYGGATGIDRLQLLPDIVLPDDRTQCKLGASLASAGDVNQDGYADAVVGGPCATGGVLAFVLGSPTRAPLFEPVSTFDPAFRTASTDDGFGSAISYVGTISGSTVFATLATSTIRLLQFNSSRGAFELGDRHLSNAPYSALRWQGLTGVPIMLGGDNPDPGMITHSNLTVGGNGGNVFGVRYALPARAPITGALLGTGTAGQRHGEYLAGPIDLNNDGRGDVLWASGLGGRLGHIEGGAGGPFFINVIRGENSDGTAPSIRALASVGNVRAPLIDAVAINIVRDNFSRIQLCERSDHSPVKSYGVSLACNDAFYLPLPQPASIAGR